MRTHLTPSIIRLLENQESAITVESARAVQASSLFARISATMYPGEAVVICCASDGEARAVLLFLQERDWPRLRSTRLPSSARGPLPGNQPVTITTLDTMLRLQLDCGTAVLHRADDHGDTTRAALSRLMIARRGRLMIVETY